MCVTCEKIIEQLQILNWDSNGTYCIEGFDEDFDRIEDCDADSTCTQCYQRYFEKGE